ncbi:MAG: hypothetical protein DIU78_004440 [Pseudomonadota bacterium]
MPTLLLDGRGQQVAKGVERPVCDAAGKHDPVLRRAVNGKRAEVRLELGRVSERRMRELYG